MLNAIIYTTSKTAINLILDDGYKAIIKKSNLNRVWISGFRSEEEAKDFRKNNGLRGAMIIAG